MIKVFPLIVPDILPRPVRPQLQSGIPLAIALFQVLNALSYLLVCVLGVPRSLNLTRCQLAPPQAFVQKDKVQSNIKKARQKSPAISCPYCALQ